MENVASAIPTVIEAFDSCIRYVNLLVEHRIQLVNLKTDEGRQHVTVGPMSIQMTLRHPGRKGCGLSFWL
jgi:hypothetical protein